MKSKTLIWFLIGLFLSTTAISCVHEFSVIDYSFEFSGAITYDERADQHRLTLTRVSGAEDNQYNIAFTLDGESTLTIEDMDGRSYDKSFSETFSPAMRFSSRIRMLLSTMAAAMDSPP